MYSTITTKKDSLASIKHDVMRSKKIGNNTFEVIYKDGKRAIRLHTTDIITFVGGRYVLNTNGWETVTTKDRINKYIPHGYVYQHNFIWYVRTESEGDIEYYDNMMFDQDGRHMPHIPTGNL